MNKSVRSADRTLAIFETFESARRPLQLKEIAERCELPLSTCHALVQTLLKRGYLYTMGRRKQLYPSARLLKMAQTLSANDPFISRISGVLHQLCEECNETITVAKRQDNSVFYLFALEGQRAIRYAAQAGEYRSLHSTALGKALLGAMDDASLDEWLETHPLTRVTANTIVSKAKLRQSIEDGRRNGYFIALGEQSDDLGTVAVSLAHDAEPLALSITGPIQRIEPQLEHLAQRLMQARKEIEQGEF